MHAGPGRSKWLAERTHEQRERRVPLQRPAHCPRAHLEERQIDELARFQPALAAVHAKAQARRFTGESLTGFGALS